MFVFKFSFCTPFDLRQLFFSRSIQLPLITNDKQDDLNNFSFNKFIDHQKKAQFYMNKFLSNILKALN